ncbi:MAG: hypothetical protein HUU29_14710 [Planctomycetaceae bacterium]|nr:hypothetical protein [Planctomycetaceae bacterium]
MNETKQTTESIREVEDRFIEAWGDISALWGVNRTIGRIQALLYLAQKPLDMESVTKRLAISHGNSSTSIRDLLAWGVIRKVHLPGMRRVHYEAEQDPWTWFHTCIRERRRREVVPVMQRIGEVEQLARRASKEANADERTEFKRLHGQIQKFERFSGEFIDLVDAFLAVGAGPLGKALRVSAKLIPKGKE